MRNENITSRQVINYLDSLYKPLTPQLGELRKQAEADFVPIILKDTERFLDVMLSIIKPKRILEFGTAIGYSSMCFAEICGPETQIVTLEADDEMNVVSRKNIKRLGYEDRIHVVAGDALITSQYVEGEFDLIFIDAAKSLYMDFWKEIMKKNCHKGTVIICDNVLMRGKTASDDFDPLHKFRTNMRHMREFLDYITNSDEVITSVSSAGDGISMSYVL
ncbi:MAG: O-methyltransferase [Anaerovoracaceae bacterium]|nr:O-methyltransferase [Bacillota bacterium]MDY5905714.1 O-methyltransferase [Anaerovoracaceae bacterium]